MIVLRIAVLVKKSSLRSGTSSPFSSVKIQTFGDAENDDSITENADAHRRIDFATLEKDFFLIHHAVAVGILEDKDTITCGTFTVMSTIVDNFANPNASSMIDIEIRQTE